MSFSKRAEQLLSMMEDLEGVIKETREEMDRLDELFDVLMNLINGLRPDFQDHFIIMLWQDPITLLEGLKERYPSGVAGEILKKRGEVPDWM